MSDELKVKRHLTPEQWEKIESEINDWIWELSRSDMSGLVDMLQDRLTKAEKVRYLSDDPSVVVEVLGFNPFTDKSLDPEPEEPSEAPKEKPPPDVCQVCGGTRSDGSHDGNSAWFRHDFKE